jgi:hypothetical protein
VSVVEESSFASNTSSHLRVVDATPGEQTQPCE